MLTKQSVTDFDPEIWQLIEQEKRRQEEHIELIASSRAKRRDPAKSAKNQMGIMKRQLKLGLAK